MADPDIQSEKARPCLIVLSGPSGVGKDAVLSRMRQLGMPYHITVTATTRQRRPTERDGVDYIFVTGDAFNRMVEENELLEWAEVFGNRYGVPKAQVTSALEQGRDVIMKIDVQGAATVRRLVPDAIFVFLAPPDMGELARRLRERMTESSEALKLRLATAEDEMGERGKFDFVVVNHHDRLDDTVAEIESIVDRERRRTPARTVTL